MSRPAAHGSFERSARRGAAPLPRPDDPARYTPDFSWRDAELYCEDVPLQQIADRVGTPAYVYSAASIAGAFRGLDRALGQAAAHALLLGEGQLQSFHPAIAGAAWAAASTSFPAANCTACSARALPVSRVVFSGVGQIARGDSRGAARRHSAVQRGVGSRAGAACCAKPRASDRRAPAGDARESRRRRRRAPAHLHRPPRAQVWPGLARCAAALSGAPRLALDRVAGNQRAHRLADFDAGAFPRGRWGVCGVTCVELARAGVSLRYLDFGGGLGVRYWKEQPLAPAVYARAVAAMVRPLGCHLLARAWAVASLRPPACC